MIHKMAEIYNGENKNELLPISKEFELDATYKKYVLPTIKNFFDFFERYKQYEYETEKEYELKTDQYWLYGIIDRIMTRTKDMVVVDYKTAASPNRDRYEFQMKFYSLMVSKILEIEPQSIKTLIYFPRPNAEEKFAFSNSEINVFEKEIISTIKTIEDTTEWTACKGFHCKWCLYKNSHCPIYKTRE
jgi:RecB family exonuclease